MLRIATTKVVRKRRIPRTEIDRYWTTAAMGSFDTTGLLFSRTRSAPFTEPFFIVAGSWGYPVLTV